MFDLQRYIRFLPNLGIDPIDNAVSYYPHDKSVGSHLCDERMNSNELNVGHKPLPIWWMIKQICSLTMECEAYQFVPKTSMSRQFVSKLLTILQLIRVLPAWIDDHPSTCLRLCKVAPLSFLPVHSIPRRIFEHVLPCRETTQPISREAFSQPGNFSVTPAEIRDSNISLYSFIRTSFGWHSRWVHSKDTWSRNEVGSSRTTFFIKFSTWRPCSGSFQPFSFRPRKPIRIILVFHEQTNIQNLVLFPTQMPTELPRTVIPTLVQQVGVRTNLAHDLGHSSRGRRLQISGRWNPEQSGSIFTWVYADTASAACPAHPGSLAMASIGFAAVICDADEPCSVKTAWAPETSFTLSPRSTTRPLHFWNVGSNSAFFEMTDVHQCGKLGFRVVSLCFQKNLLSAFNFVQLPCWNRFELLPFLVQCWFCIRNFHRLGHRKQTCEPSCNESLNWILCLRCDLHDLPEEIAVSWTHAPARYMHALL